MSQSQTFSISSTADSQNSSTLSQASTTSHRRLSSIKSVSSTQKCCFLCKNKDERKSIPKSALRQVWEEKNILLPQNNRCCSVHLINGKFSSEALDEIVSNKSGVLMNDEQIAAWILELSTKPTNKYKKNVRFDFEKEDELSEDEYKTLLGIGKEQFKILFNYIKGHIKDSCNRHPKNALALFLCLLRLNVSQPVLGNLLFMTLV